MGANCEVCQLYLGTRNAAADTQQLSLGSPLLGALADAEKRGGAVFGGGELDVDHNFDVGVHVTTQEGAVPCEREANLRKRSSRACTLMFHHRRSYQLDIICGNRTLEDSIEVLRGVSELSTIQSLSLFSLSQK